MARKRSYKNKSKSKSKTRKGNLCRRKRTMKRRRQSQKGG
uniref:Uncharacterized protein n=1 Tax=viral metagenome TaxID=1070528 RepID=A0A6C0IR92_9ZZZZ